ncbi:GntR family transcriptional regulator [Streptomyces brasiliensis]|uniref:Transcriptional regulator n=1 Tax=Streptomyces brasiliensis TaxID=1954 RepID=A0A917NK72_9ACTN|nr:GntR family transcriptional regulator [Streptomyces brasiliensis]GGJ06992.1 transcriptional regulator [Streptomyces brasiliensis]
MASAALPSGSVSKLERSGPLRERVYEALLDLIVTRSLKPGQHLVETELAGLLGVSRQPVREALQRLNTEGWVDLRPAQGAFVHDPTEEEADQLLVVRGLLEAEAARLAAANATPETTARLRELCEAGERALKSDDIDAVVAANAAFHAYVMETAANSVLAELSAQVDRRVRWFYTPVARSRGALSWDEHQAMIDAIESGDEQRAQRLMRAHTEHTRTSYRERTTRKGRARSGR